MKELKNNNKPLFILLIMSLIIFVWYIFTINVKAEEPEMFYYFIKDNLLPNGYEIIKGDSSKVISSSNNKQKLPTYNFRNKVYQFSGTNTSNSTPKINDHFYNSVKISLNTDKPFQLVLESNDLYYHNYENSNYFKPDHQYIASLYLAFPKNESDSFIKYIDSDINSIKACTTLIEKGSNNQYVDTYPYYYYCNYVKTTRDKITYKEFTNSDGSTWVVAEFLYYFQFVKTNNGKYQYTNDYGDINTVNESDILRYSNPVKDMQYFTWVLDIDSSYYNQDISFYVLGQNIKEVSDILEINGVHHDEPDWSIWSDLQKDAYCDGTSSSPYCSFYDSETPLPGENEDDIICDTLDILCWAEYLVVPKGSDIKDSGESLLNKMKEKLGFISYPITFTIDLINRFINITDTGDYSFSWNDITLPVISDIPIIKGGTFSFNDILQEDNIKYVHDLYLIILDGILILNFLNLCRKKYDLFLTERNEVGE